jgi:mannose-6-phosphate isomerase-like protein (cupin superfamily)
VLFVAILAFLAILAILAVSLFSLSYNYFSEVRQMIESQKILVRHEGHVPRERSTCGWRDRLISREDVVLEPAAWAHAVDIDGALPHFHKVATELYFVLEGGGSVTVNGVEHEVRKGSLVHIPPGVVHSAQGKMRVLVVGIPDISDDDYFAAADE